MSFNFNDAVALGLEELYRRKEELESQENIDAGVYNVITNAISHLESEQEQKQATEERQQKQAEHIDGLLAAVFDLGLFEAIEPKPDEGERLFEYDERRKEFYHIIHDFVKEQQQSLIDLHNTEIEEKDNRLQLLLKQGYEVQLQLDAANDTIRDMQQTYLEQVDQLQEVQRIVEENSRTIEGQKLTIAQKDGEIQRLIGEKDELTRKLEQSKPAEYHAPSSSITDRVANLKAKSSRSVDEMMSRFYERNGIPAPELTPPTFDVGGEQPNGESFRGEDPNSSEPTSNVQQERTTGANEGISGEDVKPFPAADVDTTSAGLSSETTENDRAVGFDAEAEIEKLKKRIDRLEERANINKEVA